MTNETELHTRIRQLEDEVARYRAVNESTRAETARACLVAWWSNGKIAFREDLRAVDLIVGDILALEEALAAQVEREKANG